MFPPPTEQLSMQAAAVFEDVVEEFWNLSLIKQRFEEWKFGVPESYEQVYVPLFLPKLFGPFVRLQLLQWNPLEVSSIPDMYIVHTTVTHTHTHTHTHTRWAAVILRRWVGLRC